MWSHGVWDLGWHLKDPLELVSRLMMDSSVWEPRKDGVTDTHLYVLRCEVSYLLSPWATLSWGKAHLYWDPVSMSVASARATLFGVQPAPHPKSRPGPVVKIWEATVELWDSEPRRAILGQEASKKGVPQQGGCHPENQQRVRAGSPVILVPEGRDMRPLPTPHTRRLDTLLSLHCCDGCGFTVGFKLRECESRGALGGQFVSFSSVQLLSRVRLFATPWTAAHQASLSNPVHHQLQRLLKLMSIEFVMPSNHLILCHPLPLLPSIFPSQGLFKWVSSLHQVAKVLEFQPQHQYFQWVFRTDFF